MFDKEEITFIGMSKQEAEKGFATFLAAFSELHDYPNPPKVVREILLSFYIGGMRDGAIWMGNKLSDRFIFMERNDESEQFKFDPEKN